MTMDKVRSTSVALRDLHQNLGRQLTISAGGRDWVIYPVPCFPSPHRLSFLLESFTNTVKFSSYVISIYSWSS